MESIKSKLQNITHLEVKKPVYSSKLPYKLYSYLPLHYQVKRLLSKVPQTADSVRFPLTESSQKSILLIITKLEADTTQLEGFFQRLTRNNTFVKVLCPQSMCQKIPGIPYQSTIPMLNDQLEIGSHEWDALKSQLLHHQFDTAMFLDESIDFNTNMIIAEITPRISLRFESQSYPDFHNVVINTRNIHSYFELFKQSA